MPFVFLDLGPYSKWDFESNDVFDLNYREWCESSKVLISIENFISFGPLINSKLFWFKA